MVNDRLRKEIWYGLDDSVRISRYYTLLADRYQRYQNFSHLALFIVACGAVVAFLDLLPMHWSNKFEPIIGFLLLVTVLVDFSFDFASKAAKLHVVATECSYIEGQYRTLWRKHPDLNDEAAEKNL